VAAQRDAEPFALAHEFAEAMYTAGSIEVCVGKVQRKKGRVAQVLSLVARMPDDEAGKRALIASYKRLAKQLQVTEPMSNVGEHLIEVPSG
jgi:hypothetical protein